MIHFHRDPKFLSHLPLLVIGNKRESMLVVGVRGSRRDMDEGREKERLEEVTVFLDLGFEMEKNRWRFFYFFFGFQCVVEKVNKTNVLSFFGFFF